MGLRPTKADEDAKWGGPPGPALRASSIRLEADGGVGCGPGGRPQGVTSTESVFHPAFTRHEALLSD